MKKIIYVLLINCIFINLNTIVSNDNDNIINIQNKQEILIEV